MRTTSSTDLFCYEQLNEVQSDAKIIWATDYDFAKFPKDPTTFIKLTYSNDGVLKLSSTWEMVLSGERCLGCVGELTRQDGSKTGPESFQVDQFTKQNDAFNVNIQPSEETTKFKRFDCKSILKDIEK